MKKTIGKTIDIFEMFMNFTLGISVLIVMCKIISIVYELIRL